MLELEFSILFKKKFLSGIIRGEITQLVFIIRNLNWIEEFQKASEKKR